MTPEERRVKVIEKLIDNTMNDLVAMEVGIEVKQAMAMMMPNSPAIPKIDQAIQQSELAIAEHKKVLDILERKLKDANEVLRGITG